MLSCVSKMHLFFICCYAIEAGHRRYLGSRRPPPTAKPIGKGGNASLSGLTEVLRIRRQARILAKPQLSPGTHIEFQYGSENCFETALQLVCGADFEGVLYYVSSLMCWSGSRVQLCPETANKLSFQITICTP